MSNANMNSFETIKIFANMKTFETIMFYANMNSFEIYSENQQIFSETNMFSANIISLGFSLCIFLNMQYVICLFQFCSMNILYAYVSISKLRLCFINY